MVIRYGPQSAQTTIQVFAPVNVTVLIEIFGSGDDYAGAHTEFSNDETILVRGTILADDGADFTSPINYMEIYLDGGLQSNTVPITGWNATDHINHYEYTFASSLSAGPHTIMATFPRVNIV